MNISKLLESQAPGEKRSTLSTSRAPANSTPPTPTARPQLPPLQARPPLQPSPYAPSAHQDDALPCSRQFQAYHPQSLLPTPRPAQLPPISPSTPLKRSADESTDRDAELPDKRHAKWTPEEDGIVIELRRQRMKWEDIAKQVPGRSAISCRLRYQNYSERKPEWDDSKKIKLARLYNRFRRDMFEMIASELNMPWRAVEAQHWEMGAKGISEHAGKQVFQTHPSSSKPGSSRDEASGPLAQPEGITRGGRSSSAASGSEEAGGSTDTTSMTER